MWAFGCFINTILLSHQGKVIENRIYIYFIHWKQILCVFSIKKVSKNMPMGFIKYDVE